MAMSKPRCEGEETSFMKQDHSAYLVDKGQWNQSRHLSIASNQQKPHLEQSRRPPLSNIVCQGEKDEQNMTE